ncbi:hypothetical protein HZP39_04100 [Elizabethkingia anophelis]|nr:hypothetical protein [Elizabethkingia anophelis]MCT4239407.1 hypothetical protein [Elizabethkingia anophelis]MCT4282022.1 hypothetical protein [Elizabethkingia anophelis]MCT4292607.1 hypothetical protein [Elizabethkingia anophelis]MDV3661665.1 hypothetical protein [Elizabethkingia anophelis]
MAFNRNEVLIKLYRKYGKDELVNCLKNDLSDRNKMIKSLNNTINQLKNENSRKINNQAKEFASKLAASRIEISKLITENAKLRKQLNND